MNASDRFSPLTKAALKPDLRWSQRSGPFTKELPLQILIGSARCTGSPLTGVAKLLSSKALDQIKETRMVLSALIGRR